MKALRKYKGIKIFFAQDDYDHVQKNILKYNKCKIDIPYLIVLGHKARSYIYPKDKMQGIKIKHYLTGYVPDAINMAADISIKPIRERKTDIFDRGNDVGCAYGQLGYEKYEIGVSMKGLLNKNKFVADIKSSIDKQIYGKEYLMRMANAKATLLTESGSSIIFNNDKYMKQRLEIIKRTRDLEEFYTPQMLAEQYPEYFANEGKHVVAEISPKCFEAIACKTAIIGFEGDFFNVLKPDAHYIVLKKDYSNIDEVLDKLKDFEYLQSLVNFAYVNIIVSNKYSYESIIRSFDKELE